MTINFISPGWLLLLPLCWLAVGLYVHYRQQYSMWRNHCDPHLLKVLVAGQATNKRPLVLVVLLIALFSIGVLAMAGPSWQSREMPVLESAAARVVVVDLSRSMLVEDLQPNRLTVAIDLANKIISSDYDGETGLVVFAGAAFVVAPLTRDSNSLLEFLAALGPDSMPLDGSRLDLALARARYLLAASISGSGRVIVLTDGASSVEKARNEMLKLREQGSHVLLIATGTEQGAPIKQQDGSLLRDDKNQFVLARLRISDLESIARAGNAEFIHMLHPANGFELLASASRSVDSLQNKAGEGEPGVQAVNGGVWLVWLMLPLALLLFRRNSLLLLLLVLVPLAENEVYATDLSSVWLNHQQQAFEAFGQGDFERAVELSSDPALLGSAWFRLADYQAAEAKFAELDTSVAHFNRGNALAFQHKFEAAIRAFERALELDPKFQQAWFNRQKLLAHMKATDSEVASTSDDDDASNDEAADADIDQPNIGESSPEIESRDASDIAGIGASLLAEQIRFDQDQEFSGDEAALEQFLQRVQAEKFDPDQQQIRLWADRLLADPAELFRRKFLRDYKRNQNTPR